MPAQKTILVTGCSAGGIGDALAREFHSRGHRVFATGRSQAKVQHLANLGIETIILEVTSPDSIKTAAASVSELTGGKLDILVNNAGQGYQAPLLDADLEKAKRMFDINVFGVIGVTQAFSPLLIASKGTVVNIGSVAGITPIVWQGFYNASKAAVSILSDGLRIELTPFDVKVTAVITGLINTSFFENQARTTLPENSLYHPAKDVVEEVMRGEGVASEGTKATTYAKSVVDNALKANPTKRHWVGHTSFIVWFVSTFMWATFWDIPLGSRAKIDLVTQRIRAAVKSR